MENIKILLFEVGKPAIIKEIPNTLKSMQSVVGGYIETVNITNDICIVMNQEGKLNGMPPNRWVDFPGFLNFIFGDFFIVGSDMSIGEFVSITKEQIEELAKTVKLFRIF